MVCVAAACTDAATDDAAGAGGAAAGEVAGSAGVSGTAPLAGSATAAVGGGGAAMQAGAAGETPPRNAGAGGASAAAEDAGNGDARARDASPPDAGPASADAAAPGSDAAAPVECPASPLAPGEHMATLMHDGEERTSLVYVPAGYDNSAPVPLVVNFHGGLQSSAQQRRFSVMNPMADDEGFVVAYPQGLDNVWDAGACCSSVEVDDVGFTRALVAYIQERLCIDDRRIYATGMSNGGRMSYRLGCEAADLFAAIAPVAGIKSFPDLDNTPGCQPSRPISLIDFQGTADESHYRYQAGQIAEWVAFNGCTDAAPQETYRNGGHYCSTYSQCEQGTSVTFCVVPDGGHCWPGSYPCPLGDTSRPEELSANELMWELFERSRL